jgi:amino acid transporter
MENPNKKLGALALSTLVVSAMIGGGIFSLPQNMAQSAGLTAVLIAWIITGVGMFFLANTFRTLSEARPDAAAGIYTYARLGFGRFAGFQMAWAYYLSNVFGNVGYAVLLMDAMNYFFPGTFTGGNNIYSRRIRCFTNTYDTMKRGNVHLQLLSINMQILSLSCTDSVQHETRIVKRGSYAADTGRICSQTGAGYSGGGGNLCPHPLCICKR